MSYIDILHTIFTQKLRSESILFLNLFLLLFIDFKSKIIIIHHHVQGLKAHTFCIAILEFN